MKLLYCPKCGDLRKLDYDKTHCRCEMSWGYYEPDGLHAVYGGDSCPLGVANSSLIKALNEEFTRRGQEIEPMLGIRFEAFTIPEGAPTIQREE